MVKKKKRFAEEKIKQQLGRGDFKEEDTILTKAKRLVEEKKIKIKEMDDREILFNVVGDTSEHEITYDRIKDRWYCDCKWFRFKGVEDSHILSCKLFMDKVALNGESNFWGSEMQVKFVPQSKAIPSRRLLPIALEKLGYEWDDILKTDMISDSYGVFAVNLEEFILVAKGYVMRVNIVSCHKRAVYFALKQKKYLLMYIRDEKKFYEFSPKKIIENSWENWKGTVPMLNFNINLGKPKKVI